MHTRGIHYDVGTTTLEGGTTRPYLTVERLEHDLGDIARGLHANAVRVTGGDVGRIHLAATTAARLGLDPWLTPMLPNADASATLAAIDEAARAAADVAASSAGVTLVIGCELSAFMSGILPGASHGDRLSLLMDSERLMAAMGASGRDPQADFQTFLRTASETARRRFTGPVTYASGLWEDVDWSLFDLIGLDAYRDAASRDSCAGMLRRHAGTGRRVVITETGCATYRGAAAAGGMAWTAVERTGEPRRLREGVVRDEHEQAGELENLLAEGAASGVSGAFIYTYDAPSYPSNVDPRFDLDAASYALVRTWPDGRTEPKAAYRAVARAYEAYG
jgi:hypothetical protein